MTGNAAKGSVWFTWTAPASGEYRVDTSGSRFDTLLAVYTGSALASLVRVASSDNISPQEQQSAVTFTAVAGTLYHIAVDAHDVAARGDLRLNITHFAVVTSYALLPGSPRTFSLTWRSEPWTTYRVERSADLNSWLMVTDCLPSWGASTSFDVGGLSTGTLRQYFRVRRE